MLDVIDKKTKEWRKKNDNDSKDFEKQEESDNVINILGKQLPSFTSRQATNKKLWSDSYFWTNVLYFYAVTSSLLFGTKNLCFACVLLTFIENHQSNNNHSTWNRSIDHWWICSLTPRTLFWMFWLVLGERSNERVPVTSSFDVKEKHRRLTWKLR